MARKEGEPAGGSVEVDMDYDVSGSVIQLRHAGAPDQPPEVDAQQSAIVRGLTVTINQSRVAAWALFAFFAWGAMSELTKYVFRDAAAPLLVLWYVMGAVVVFIGLGALVLCFGRIRDAIVHMEERARSDNGYFRGSWGYIRRAILHGHRTSRSAKVGGRAAALQQHAINRSDYVPLPTSENVNHVKIQSGTHAAKQAQQPSAAAPTTTAAAAAATAAPSATLSPSSARVLRSQLV